MLVFVRKAHQDIRVHDERDRGPSSPASKPGAPGAPKKRRRRRRGVSADKSGQPPGSTAGGAEVGGPTVGHSGESGRRRRRRRRGDPENTPVTRVVADAAKAEGALADKAAEEPLTPEELVEMRRHLRFLKEHRRVLHLRVNASEDLLLNEKRDPTHRGVCQHLLSKVDRAHVFRAVERLEPAAATRLSEGVLRISPNIDYLLLYLDCVRRSEAQEAATAALAEALSNLDFSELSSGQMRRVLNLIVELFRPAQLPLVLLGLFEGNAFRTAFDASAEALPAPLAELVRPIREVHTVVVRDRNHRSKDPELLARGIQLLLAGGARPLLRYSPPVRQRLLELAIRSGIIADTTLRTVSDEVLQSLQSQGPRYWELQQEMAQVLIGLGDEEAARKVLKALARNEATAGLASRWLKALDAPRLGRIALTARSSKGASERRSGREGGVFLGTMRRVTVSYPADNESAELRANILVPGIAPVVDRGTDATGRDYIAVARYGERLSFLLDRKRSVDVGAALRACAEGANVLAVLAKLGWRLPDARSERFELDGHERLWLVDLEGIVADVETADASHARLVLQFCREVLARARGGVAPHGLFEALQHAKDSRSAVATLSRYL